MGLYWRRLIQTAIGTGLAVLAFIVVDWLVFDKSLIQEGHPDVSVVGWLRSALLLICSLMLASALKGRGRLQYHFPNICIHGFVIITGYLASAFTVLLITAPQLFNVLSHEDSLVEWASFAFLLAGAVLLALASVRSFRRRAGWLGTGCLVLALGFWLVGMEEVSWFQRQVGFDTPDTFGGNVQEEFNLHNFFTVGFEILYYVGSFVLLVALPFLRSLAGDWIEKNPFLRVVVPYPYVAVFGALSCGFNYEMWNIFPVQFSLIASVVILAIYVQSDARHADRLLALFSVTALVASQWVFLASGERYERI